MRNRDPRVDVRPRFPRSLHAADQECVADDPLRDRAYRGVHCRLTLLGSTTRTDPQLSAPPHECCCPPGPCCDACSDDARLAHAYQPCADDPRVVRQYGAREAIATSTGQNDTGLFVLDFNDQRYLPFEYMGAVKSLAGRAAAGKQLL